MSPADRAVLEHFVEVARRRAAKGWATLVHKKELEALERLMGEGGYPGWTSPKANVR